MDINNEEKQYLNFIRKGSFSKAKIVMIEQELELKMYLVNN